MGPMLDVYKRQVTDGMGAVLFIRALVTRYLQLKRGDVQELKPMPEENAVEPEDSYLKNYRKLPKKRYSSCLLYTSRCV